MTPPKKPRLNLRRNGNRGNFSHRLYDFFQQTKNFNPMGFGIAVNLDLLSVGIAVAGTIPHF